MCQLRENTIMFILCHESLENEYFIAVCSNDKNRAHVSAYPMTLIYASLSKLDT